MSITTKVPSHFGIVSSLQLSWHKVIYILTNNVAKNFWNWYFTQYTFYQLIHAYDSILGTFLLRRAAQPTSQVESWFFPFLTIYMAFSSIGSINLSRRAIDYLTSTFPSNYESLSRHHRVVAPLLVHLNLFIELNFKVKRSYICYFSNVVFEITVCIQTNCF